MTKIAIWCRHQGDNVIGIGPNIPWHISSDFKRFRRITEGQSLVAGEKTYESFPNRTLPNRKIFVLSFNSDYEVSDKANHFVVNDIKAFKDFEGNLFIAGGAGTYKAFFSNGAKLLPDIIVDSCYQGALDVHLTGEKVDITPCIDVMNKKFVKVSQDYDLDDILTTVWVQKGAFVDQAALKHIVKAIEDKKDETVS